MRQELVPNLQTEPLSADDAGRPIDAVFDADAEAGVSCIRCGYSLKGLDHRRPCPECGLLVGLSLRDGRELRHNRPRWLRALSWGAWATAGGILLAPTISLGQPLLLQWHIARGSNFPVLRLGALPAVHGTPGEVAAALALMFMPPLLLLLGGWLLATPAGRATSDEADRYSRLALRVTAVLPVVAVALIAASTVEWLRFTRRHEEWIFGAFLVLLAPLPILLSWRLRDLARRAPAPALAADGPVVGIVLGASLIVLAVYTVVIERIDPLAISPWLTALDIFAGLAVAAGITALLWSLYLLIRYAIAFARTARQARSLVREHDARARAALT